MVLTRALAVVVVLSGCITGQPVSRSPSRLPVAAAFVLDTDASRDVVDAPETLRNRVNRALDARNLELAPGADLTDAFRSIRSSDKRLAKLVEVSKEPLALLVETKASFYSLLNGRYRWNVYAKVTIARHDAPGSALTADLDLPAMLDFDHYREPEAIAVVAPEIADAAGRLFDQLLGQQAAAEPPKSPPLADAVLPIEGGKDVIYFIMVDRFQNGDRSNDGAIDLADPAAFHGGDLQGILDRLDYLQGLGVTTLWLSPVTKMRTASFHGHGAFHGYWPLDHAEIEPRFGTKALLRKLRDALHARGMKLLLDVVLNHVAYDAPLVTQKPDWFHHHGDVKDWNDPVQVVDNDVHGLPDLDQSNPAVYDYLLKSSLGWIDDVRPDGFRLDAVKHIPLPFWARFNDAVRAHAGAGFFLLGELLDGDPVAIAKTLKDGRFTSLFDFPLHYALIDTACRHADPKLLDATLWQDRAYADPSRLVTLIDNHDLPRAATTCPDAKDRKRLLSSLMEVRGIPCINYGTESWMPGAHEPETRADMVFAEGAAPFVPSKSQRRVLDDGTTAIAKITVKQVPSADATKVVMIGSDALGRWSPSAAVPLQKQGDDAWGTTITQPTNAVFAYKFAYWNRAGELVWEERPNRYLVMRQGDTSGRWGEAPVTD